MNQRWWSSTGLALASCLALAGCGKGEPASGQDASKPAPMAEAPAVPKPAPKAPAPEGQEQPGTAQPAPADPKLAHLPEALQRAIEQARREKKLVVVDVHDATCPYCDEMGEELKDEAVQKALAEGFVFVKLGTKTQAERRIVEEFSLIKVPTFLFYKGDGTPLEDFLEGVRSAQVFLVELKNMKILAAGGDEFLEVPDDDHPSYGLG